MPKITYQSFANLYFVKYFAPKCHFANHSDFPPNPNQTEMDSAKALLYDI